MERGIEDQRQVLHRFGSFLLLRHKEGATRYWEIDALRGLAIGMMVVYHLAYDLTQYGYYQTNVFVGPWRFFARITASLFILLVGISLALGQARTGSRSMGWPGFKRYLARGLKLVGWGMVITLTTWLYMGQAVIIFGILHLIGTSIILAYPFLSLRWANLPLGAAAIALGFYLNPLPVTHPWLLWLGLRPPSLFQLDYFPLLPWFGLVLLGLFIGQRLYPGGTRRFNLPDLDARPGLEAFAWLGRRSLAIYLLHQPVLFATLALLSRLG